MDHDFFNLLNITPSVLLEESALTENYKKLAAEHHPDSGGNETTFNLLNKAYQTLRSPSQRIKHLMDLAGTPYDKRGSVSNHLMDLFMSTGSLLQKTDTFIKKKYITTSILAKALLENESLELQETISSQIDAIESAQQSTLSNTTSTELYETAFRDLAFLEKWQAQLKERYAQLF